MAMMARGLGPARHVYVHRFHLGGACGGARTLLLPELRAAGSTSSPISASRLGRNAAGGTTRPYSAEAAVGGVTPATTTRENPLETSASSLWRSTSGSIRRGVWSSSWLDDNKAAPAGAGRLNPARAPAAALLLYGHRGQQPRRVGVVGSARASREWRSAGERVASVQFAGFRTSAGVFGPAAGGNDAKTAGDAQKKESAGEGKTVKGGNPACRSRDRDTDKDRDGSFIQMRERIRQGRLDASEDAKDWVRDKRDDMNTMKEVSQKQRTTSTTPSVALLGLDM